jgi:GT2 family glycosyltransferase
VDDVAEIESCELSVIVPARDEAESLPACLASLVAQSEPGFALGREWELIVVDDGSSDGTRALAERCAGVRVMEAPALEDWFTGKTNACWAGAQAACGKVLLFTDADTVHELGDLSRARHELEKHRVAMLSYSPRQLTSGLTQRVLMPLVFAELSVAYPPARVSADGDRTAAANGQFLMVEAEDYFAVGGHKAVGHEVLEDVALARLMKRAGRRIRLRYAPDALAARMYRTTAAMMDGWTKNLALLFPNPLGMAAIRGLVLGLIVILPVLALVYPFFTSLQRGLIGLVWLRGVWFFYARVSKSNFPFADCALSVLGVPLFIYLLLRSYLAVKVNKSVEWKGRRYSTSGPGGR